MDLGELLRIVWQRKLVVLLVGAAIVALGMGSLALQTPIYRATATVSLTPARGVQDPIIVISQIDVITPLYAEAVETQATQERARALRGGRGIGDISVRTFHGAAIIKIDSESSSPLVAQAGAQAVTDALLTRTSAGEIGYTGTLELKEIDRPQRPTDPVRPNPKLTLLVSLLLGGGFGVAAGVAWDRLGKKVESTEELVSATGLQPYGEIPADRGVPTVASPAALVNDQRLRVVAEALRDVRTNLQFTNGGFRSILVTSPEGRHGKTFVSFGLAATLARSGARTLLVDADLRRGRTSEMLGMSRSPGLMEVLQGMPFGRAVQPTDLDTLSVLTGGTLADDPGELLESSFFQVLYDLEAAYDVVVVDGTPLVPVNDARLMARYVSAVLLVVSAGSVTRRQVRTAVDRLSIIGINATAAVLNGSRQRRRASYYRYLTPDERVARPS
jgi:capsular exopolysaccharide synthesis family protein